MRRDHDSLRLHVAAFVGNPVLARRAREAFLQSPGFCSFEVSTFSGEVYIGFCSAQFQDGKARIGAHDLMREFLPGLDEQALAPRH